MSGYKNIVITILSVLVVIYSSGQNTQVINQLHRLELASDSLEKVYIYHDIVSQLKETSVDQAIEYNKKALTLANKINSADACGATNEIMGELYGNKNYIQPAINYYLISAKIYEGLNNYRKLSSIYGNLGMLYYNNNYDYERTLFYYRKSLDYAVKLNDKSLIGEVYNRIGRILFNQNNFEDARYYFNNAKDIFEDLDNKVGAAVATNNIGEIYRMKGELNNALKYYNRSMKLNETANNIRLKAITLENIGLVNSLQGNKKKALEYYNNSLELYKNIDDFIGRSELYLLIAEENINASEFENAYNSYENAYQLAMENNQWEQIKESSLGLSRVFENKKQYKESLKFLRIYARYNDSIIKKQMSDELFDLQSHFLRNINEKELQIKDADIELLESEQRINQLKQYFLIFGGLLLIILSVLTVIRLRNRVKKERLINQKDRQLHETQKELLRLELDNKDNDLINFALHLVQKNEVLKQLKYDLGKLPVNDDNELNRKIKELSIHVQQSLQINKDIEEFQQKVDLTYDDFFDKLKVKFPSLTKNEKRLCALLRLNLSTKEISSLNNTSIKAVEMSRYRLRKKCNLNNAQSLSEYLQNI